MAQSGVPAWSKTGANNATADPNINWAEGMAPSAVNDSARAMMAAIAKHRDDVAGSLVTGGTSTAYTLSTNTTFDSLSSMNGMMVRLKFHTTNGTNPTLNVDSLGAKSILVTSGVNVPDGFLTGGCIFDLLYDNSIPGWVCVNCQYQLLVPGTRMIFNQTAAPTGWTKDVGLDDFALRGVSGTVTTVSSATGFSGVFTSRTITQANLPNVTLTTTIVDPGHTHTAIAGSNTTTVTNGSGPQPVASVSNSSTGSQTTGITASTSLGGSGTPMSFSVNYRDVIVATKN